MPLAPGERDNLTRWYPDEKGGIEIYDLCCRVPGEEMAFWLRYSLESPLEGGPHASLTSLVSNLIDPDQDLLLTEQVPAKEARIEREIFYLQIRSSAIYQTGARGRVRSGKNEINWDLKFHGSSPPLRQLPAILQITPFPSVKLISRHLFSALSGRLVINDREIPLQSVTATQSHLWGRLIPPWLRVTCLGFEEDLRASFEGIIFPLRLRGKTSRPITLLSFFYQGRRYSFRSPIDWFRNKGFYEKDRWHFEASSRKIRFVGDLVARPAALHESTLIDADGIDRPYLQTAGADLKIEVFEKRPPWTLTGTLRASKAAFLEVLPPLSGG